MPKFRWTDRKTFISRAAVQAYNSFVQMVKWLEEEQQNGNYEGVVPSVNLNDPFDELILAYCKNPEDMSGRSIKLAQTAILVEFYEIARTLKNNVAFEWVNKEMDRRKYKMRKL